MPKETAYQVRLFQNLTEEIFQTPRFPKSSRFLHSPGETLLSNEKKPKGSKHCDGNHWSNEKRQDKETMLHFYQST